MSTSLEVPMLRRRREFTAVLAALMTAFAVLSAPTPAYATAERPHTIPALSEWHVDRTF